MTTNTHSYILKSTGKPSQRSGGSYNGKSGMGHSKSSCGLDGYVRTNVWPYNVYTYKYIADRNRIKEKLLGKLPFSMNLANPPLESLLKVVACWLLHIQHYFFPPISASRLCNEIKAEWALISTHLQQLHLYLYKIKIAVSVYEIWINEMLIVLRV